MATGPPSAPGIVVAGAGIAGLTSGLRAQELGASVTILEAAPEVGGSAAMSAGVTRAYADFDTFRRLNPSGEPGPARAIVENFDAAMAILQGLDIPMKADPCLAQGRTPLQGRIRENGCCQPGSIYTRHYRISDTRAAMDRMAEAFRDRGGRIMTGVRVQRLLAQEGRVTGVGALSPTGPVQVQAHSVVLATGGFQGNTELLARYMGPWSGLMPLRANPWSTGDGLLAGLEMGAAASRGLHAFYGHLLPAPPAVLTPANFLPTTARYSLVSVLVNLAGRRFVDESIDDDVSARAAVRLNPRLAEAYVGRGVAYTVLGRDSESQQDVERAAELGFDPAVLKGVIEEAKEHR